jgi:hypothetical protein
LLVVIGSGGKKLKTQRRDIMAGGKRSKGNARKTNEPIPPGARTRATERDERPGGQRATPAGDRHAQGTPAGGTEVGGLAGTPISEGSPQNADLEEVQGTGAEAIDRREEVGPYAGPAGGAVGGTPAGGRSSGGRTHKGIRPGGVHRGDSTIGTNPDLGAE